jgi:hypothetical protein
MDSYILKRREEKLKDKKPKKKGIPKMSARQKDRMKKYLKIRSVYMKEHPRCEALISCKGSPATDVHHVRGRRGNDLFDTENFCAVCRPCHIKIHEKHDLAKELGLSKSRLRA